jgi:FMN phosphatase YigB (HAD superfamily)
MIKNLLFDLGGVLLNLDQNKTLHAFDQLGLNPTQLSRHIGLLNDFETGKCSVNFFTKSLQNSLPSGTTEAQIIDAWNAMLLDFPVFRIEILKVLKKTYHLYLFSNTNTIHITEVLQYTDGLFGKNKFESLFDGVYYSHVIGMRKPEIKAYEHVLNLANINGHETLFIDDNESNILGAQKAGLHTMLAKHPIEPNFVNVLTQMLIDV